jgi:hypothetical protein
MRFGWGVLGLTGLLSVSSAAFAASTSVDLRGIGALGSFDARAQYEDTTATLTVSITNTSSDGWLTGIAFNNPERRIRGVSSFGSSDSDFRVLGGRDWNDEIRTPGYGRFDIGAATGRNFTGSAGSGSPRLGIGAGSTGTFSFVFTGTRLSTLTVFSFFGDGADDHRGRDHSYGGASESFVVRFRGFENGGSDTVPGDTVPGAVTPIPAAGVLFLSGLALLAGWGRRRSRAAVA